MVETVEPFLITLLTANLKPLSMLMPRTCGDSKQGMEGGRPSGRQPSERGQALLACHLTLVGWSGQLPTKGSLSSVQHTYPCAHAHKWTQCELALTGVNSMALGSV